MCNTGNPKVIIVIPVYNGSNYMREAINSALAQTYQNVEILVINDGSTDGGETERIAKSYGNRIRYYAKENGGVSTALNYAIEKSNSEYLSWLSHDDMYTPEKIEKEVALAQKAGDNAVIYCGYTSIDESAKIIKNYHLPTHITQNVKCLIALDTTYTLNGCTMLIPLSLFSRCGKFNPELRFTQDYDLWLRFIEQGAKFIYLDECLMLSRQHREQGGRASGAEVTLESDRLHSRAIRALTIEEVNRYIEGDLSRLESLYKTYAANGYLATAIDIISLIVHYISVFLSDEKAEVFIEKQIGIKRDLCSNYQSFACIKRDPRPALVFCINGWFYGGIERVLISLLPYFVKKYQVFIFSSFVGTERGFDIPGGITKITLEHNHYIPLSVRMAALTRIYGAKIFVGNANPREPFFPVFPLLRSLSIKSIIMNHYYYFLPYWIDALNTSAETRHYAFSNADVVLWLTNFSACVCMARHDNVGIMPNPNSYSIIDESLREYPDKKTIIAVGRFFDINKRADKIIRIFAAVYHQDSQARFIMIGSYNLDTVFPMSSNKTLRDILNETNLPEHVITFVGEKADVHDYYRDASVLVMASEYEGFPMVLTEAGVCGVPAVIHYYPGCEDIIKDGENGFIVPRDDEEKAVHQILLLIRDRSLWQKMSAGARALAKRFEQNKISNQWESLFQSLLEDGNKPSNEILKELNLFPDEHKLSQYYKTTVQEFEHYLELLILQKESLGHAAQHNTPGIDRCDTKSDWFCQYLLYKQELQAMQNTISWRITKPLRLIRKALSSLKRNGMRVTIRKIVDHLKKH